jgi:exopolysaccharide production protein ExoQ
MTVMVSLCLCMTASLKHILRLLFLALLATAVLSALLAVASPRLALGISGEWQGVFPHKNVFGHMMAIMVITGTTLFLAGWRPLVSGSGIILALGALAMSRSGTAIIALAMVMMIVPLALTSRLGPIAISMTIGIILIVTSVGLLTVEALDLDPYKAGLKALDKDETLTGRTILWEFALDAFDTRPWLGYGYKAWWESPQTDAQLLRIVVGQDLWFFHNTFLDLAVAFGVLGPIALIAGLGQGVYRSIRNFAVGRDLVYLWPILFLALSIVYCFVDFVLFVNHSISQMLLVIAIAAQQPQKAGRA